MKISIRTILVTALAAAALAVPTAQAGPPPTAPAPFDEATYFKLLTGEAFTTAQPQPAAATDSSGFDYGDAGVGAGVAMGAALLLSGAMLTTLRRRKIAHL